MADRFIITINRQYGSRGREIGMRLSELLGIKFYDRELIALASKESGYVETVFENADERPSKSLLFSLVMESYASKGWFYQQDDILSNEKLFAIQAEVIRNVAKESCIIVGRCADYILRDEPGLITVFTHAPVKYRIEGLRSENPGLDNKELESRIRRLDKQRANYYSYYTGRDWLSVENYHLAIDTSVTDVEGAVRMILDLKEIQEKKGAS
ncbi:MAG: AAA family ATPase [Eubacteriales bacterium]|jgi:cytidylate kinase